MFPLCGQKRVDTQIPKNIKGEFVVEMMGLPACFQSFIHSFKHKDALKGGKATAKVEWLAFDSR